MRLYCVYKGCLLVKLFLIIVLGGYIIDIFGLYLVGGKNNDVIVLNKYFFGGGKWVV